jgi:hypothetical protein
MSVTGLQETSLRPGRFEYKRLAWALAISLAIHGGGYGAYRLERVVMPVLLQHVRFLAALAEELRPKKPVPPPQPTEPPLVFVEVNPAVATPEPPKDAKYYSSRNSQAADVDSKADTDTPEITGRHPDLPKLDDPSRHFENLQPNLPRPEPKPELAKPKPPPGDLAMARLDPTPRQEKGLAEQSRPRTLAEAKLRQQTLPGEQRKQEGGVRRHLQMAAEDTKATITGTYDSLLYEAIAQRWYDLLDKRGDSGANGQVVVHFKLHSDGTITELTIDSNSTSSGVWGWLCYRAVQDVCAPVFQPWPEEMKRMENDPRWVQFTFNYY